MIILRNHNRGIMKRRSLLAGDEADELRDTLLDSLLGVLRDFAISRKPLLHDAADVSNRKEAILLTEAGAGAVVAALVGRTRRSIGHGRRNPNRRRNMRKKRV